MADLIQDKEKLIGAKDNSGKPINTYDAGFGPLWYHPGFMTATVVRAEQANSAFKRLTPALLSELGITLEIETDDE